MNTERAFSEIVRSNPELPASVRARAGLARGVEEHRFDRSYIGYLDEQIRLAARGPEWNARLQKRKVALEPYCDEPLIRGRIEFEERDYAIEVHAASGRVIHVEEYEKEK